MMALLEAYSITEILLFLVMFAIAFKAIVSFWDWLVSRLTTHFVKQNERTLQQRENTKRFEEIDEKLELLFADHECQQAQMKKILNKIDELIDSDKDDIKSYITEKHDYFCKLGHIDKYNLDCLEKRYSHYLDEGGNSFITDMMEELRHLNKE